MGGCQPAHSPAPVRQPQAQHRMRQPARPIQDAPNMVPVSANDQPKQSCSTCVLILIVVLIVLLLGAVITIVVLANRSKSGQGSGSGMTGSAGPEASKNSKGSAPGMSGPGASKHSSAPGAGTAGPTSRPSAGAAGPTSRPSGGAVHNRLDHLRQDPVSPKRMPPSKWFPNSGHRPLVSSPAPKPGQTATCPKCEGKKGLCYAGPCSPDNNAFQGLCKLCDATGQVSRGYEMCHDCETKGGFIQTKHLGMRPQHTFVDDAVECSKCKGGGYV